MLFTQQASVLEEVPYSLNSDWQPNCRITDVGVKIHIIDVVVDAVTRWFAHTTEAVRIGP